MVSFTLVIISLVFLYISKAKLSTELSRLIHRFGGNRNSLIVFWSIIFLPGTVIHEMSHFLFAIITGARTGKIEIFPRFLEQEWEEEERDTGVILGSVQTQRLNLLQGFFVGTAPFFVGMTLLVWLASMIKVSSESSSLLTTLFQGYLFFTISNSFFPSWTDIKHVLPLTVIVIIGFVLAWIVGLKVIIQPSPQIIGVADVISSTSFISASVNTAIIILLLVVRKSLGRRH